MGEVGVQDLAAWLLAQVQADEDQAKAAGSKAWRIEHFLCPVSRTESGETWDVSWPEPGCECCVVDGDDIHIYDEGGHDADQAQHIARWDPARVLVECDTKRRIIELHKSKGKLCTGDPDLPEAWQDYCATCGSGEPYEYPTDWPCETLRLLALPYADRPGYRPEWRTEEA